MAVLPPPPPPSGSDATEFTDGGPALIHHGINISQFSDASVIHQDGAE